MLKFKTHSGLHDLFLKYNMVCSRRCIVVTIDGALYNVDVINFQAKYTHVFFARQDIRDGFWFGSKSCFALTQLASNRIFFKSDFKPPPHDRLNSEAQMLFIYTFSPE